MHRQDNDMGLGKILVDFGRCNQAAFSRRHAEIHQQNVWAVFSHHFVGLNPVGGRRHHFHILLKIDDHRKTAPDDSVIIRDYHLHRTFPLALES
ncbi:hypothetical protein D3C81_1558110 [compost metagenome]